MISKIIIFFRFWGCQRYKQNFRKIRTEFLEMRRLVYNYYLDRDISYLTSLRHLTIPFDYILKDEILVVVGEGYSAKFDLRENANNKYEVKNALVDIGNYLARRSFNIRGKLTHASYNEVEEYKRILGVRKVHYRQYRNKYYAQVGGVRIEVYIERGK